jgi:Tfp pilus assembly protein PilV
MTPKKTRRSQSGVTLIETLISVLLLLALGAGMTSVFGFCTGMNKSQGEMATRTTELAQDKMEQLLALQFNDAASNTTVFPTATSGGTGLGGSMSASTTVGGTTKGSPVTNYVDYTDATGNLLTSSTGSFFTRQWSITTPAVTSPANLKTITVVVYASTTAGGVGSAASTTLVCLKSYNR